MLLILVAPLRTSTTDNSYINITDYYIRYINLAGQCGFPLGSVVHAVP